MHVANRKSLIFPSDQVSFMDLVITVFIRKLKQ